MIHWFTLLYNATSSLAQKHHTSMSHNPLDHNLQPSGTTEYTPVPNDGHSPPGTPLYDQPSIPMYELPSGAAPPRFQGAALREDGAGVRNSIASSAYTSAAGGSVNSSVYALNPAGALGEGARSSTFLAGYRDDPNAEEEFSSPTGHDYLEGKRATYASPAVKSRKKWFLGGKSEDDSSDQSDSGNSDNSDSGGGSTVRTVVTGGDGSTITMDDGSTFTYSNSFGGYWYFDPKDPFNNGARAQSWSPALNETFKYGEDIIRGVNLGGWLTTEPFM
ncbi:glycoside hydrolase family 5 [Pyrrhoderma noxium]|uniref:Glycoside hydrolase family 5 n=1 Tax=Pyrrhoderma noxium TaxID=2282107 RepID=A0A286UVL5_9AGAM|nr:glycoside hydrolase family 5 [Pyrrhoderma noxium]